MKVLFYTQCGGCLVWWMSDVANVWCGGDPILHTVCWMSGVMDVIFYTWCGGCLVWWISYFTHGLVDVSCGRCHFLHKVWWMLHNP